MLCHSAAQSNKRALAKASAFLLYPAFTDFVFRVSSPPYYRKFIFCVIGTSGKQGNNLPISGALPCFCIAMVFLRRRFTETIAALAIQHRARVIEHKIVFLPYMSGNFG